MSRSLSAAFRGMANASQSSECPLYLLAVAHASLPATLRYVRDVQDLVSNGLTYTAWPFEIQLCDETDEEPPTLAVQIDNASREPLASLAALTTPPTITVSVVLAGTPDTVEISLPNLLVRGVDWTGGSVVLMLGFEAVLLEPFPGDTFNPRDFPAVF